MSFETAFRTLVDDDDSRDLRFAEDRVTPDPDEQFVRATVEFVDDEEGVDRTFASLEELAATGEHGAAATGEHGAQTALAQAMTMTAVMNFAAWAWSPQASGSSQASARLLRGGPRSAPGKVAKLWSRLTKTLQKLQSLVAKIRTTLGISSITLTLGTPWTISIAVEF